MIRVSNSILVELLTFHQSSAFTGISRYTNALQTNLPPKIQISSVSPRLLPLSKSLTFLQSLPIGIHNHNPANIVHFPQIMGCGLMLWNPFHPSVATVHDLGFFVLPEEKQMLDPIARQILSLSLAGLKRVDRVICVSEFTRQSVLQHLHLPPERVTSICSGIDPIRFHRYSNARARLSRIYPKLAGKSGSWLLYVGNELPRKNLSTLLKAMAILRQRYPEIRLLKVGTAGGTRFREATNLLIETLELKETVIFFDGVSDEELAMLYSAADLLVHPSKLEGFGFPVLEAMACGTPVICADAASLPEIAGGGTGFAAARFVSPEDVTGWTNAIDDVLNDPMERRELTERGRERAAQFSWKQTATQMIEVYQNLEVV